MKALVAVAACFVLASCGGGKEVADAASQNLTGRVAAIRAAVEDGDPALAELLLQDLHGAVDESVAAGQLNLEQATAIRSAAEGVVAELGRLSVNTTPTQSPTPTPTVDPGDQERDHDNSGPGNGDDDNSGPGNGDD